MEFEIEHVAATLREAVELFEMDDRCNEVGTDEWVWLQRARITLAEFDGDPDGLLEKSEETISTEFELKFDPFAENSRWEFDGYQSMYVPASIENSRIVQTVDSQTIVVPEYPTLEQPYEVEITALSIDQNGTMTVEATRPKKFESVVVNIEVTRLAEPARELLEDRKMTNDEILFSSIG